MHCAVLLSPTPQQRTDLGFVLRHWRDNGKLHRGLTGRRRWFFFPGGFSLSPTGNKLRLYMGVNNSFVHTSIGAMCYFHVYVERQATSSVTVTREKICIGDVYWRVRINQTKAV
jgi:hypothetical protein